jgi:galactosamine-6-phosphate isomerase
MNLIHCDDYETLSARAASLVIAEIEAKPDLLLCPATGQSAADLYAALARKAGTHRGLFQRLRIVQLDEWSGLPADHPGSCHHELRTRVLQPLGISPDRYLGFAPLPADPARECERVRSELERRGPIDLCILGLGVNGHVGFNEPGPSLTPHCHVAPLSQGTQRRALAQSIRPAPTLGLTLGLAEILASRRVLLLVTGAGKTEVAGRLLAGEVSTELPASFLWLHPRAYCLIDRQVLAG